MIKKIFILLSIIGFTALPILSQQNSRECTKSIFSDYCYNNSSFNLHIDHNFVPVVFSRTIIDRDSIIDATFFVVSTSLVQESMGLYISFEDGTIYKNKNIIAEEPIFLDTECPNGNYLYNATVTLNEKIIQDLLNKRIRYLRIGEQGNIIDYYAKNNFDYLNGAHNYDVPIIIQDILACFTSFQRNLDSF